MKRSFKKIFGFLWITLGIGFLVWITCNYQAKGFDENIFRSTFLVTVKDTSDFISFTPTKPYKKIFIFYPGALVDPKAYAPFAERLQITAIKV